MRASSYAAILAALLGASLQAQNPIFVSPTGNDVTGNGTAGNPYKTISFAASVAFPGDTIQLTAGTFGDDEVIVLGTRDLTIAGMGIGTTVVRPHPTMVTTQPTGFLTAPSSAAHRAVFVFSGDKRVDVRDLTIDGAYRMPGTGRLYGAYYRDGADGSIHDVEIIGTRASPLDTDSHPAGVLVRGDNALDPCDVTVRRCFVHDFGRAGIVAYFNTELAVEFCDVRGAGPQGASGPAQLGVQVSYDALGVVRHNNVGDCNYLPGTWAGVGILLFDAGASVVEGNKVARCEEGITLSHTSASPVTASVRDNQCTASIKRGLRINGQTGVDVIDNILHGVTLLDAPVADDTVSGNVYDKNNYSDWSGAGPYGIPGSTYMDVNPRRDCDDFTGATSLPLTGLPVDVVTADFNSNGIDDFMVLEKGATPSLTYGLDGGFFVLPLPFGNPFGVSVALAVGEFNGAPGIDLAALTQNFFPATFENKVYVFAGNGLGGFTLIHTEVLPGSMVPSNIAAGAFQGLLVDDLVVSDSGGGALVLANVGLGSVWTQTPIPGVFVGGSHGVATGTIDAGGTVDIALTEGNGAFGVVHVFLNSGGGTFAAAPGSPFPVGIDPTDLVASDLDGDGGLNLIAACTGGPAPIAPGEVWVLEKLPMGFAARTFPTDVGPVTLAVGDIGDDWDPDNIVRGDVAAVNFTANTMSLMTEYGKTGFASGGLCLTGTQPRAAAFGNFDGNAWDDIIVLDSATNVAWVASGVAKARADLYGRGCSGTDGRTPFLSTEGKPAVLNQPNSTFGISVTNGRPLSATGIILADTWNGALGPCAVMTGPALGTLIAVNGLQGEKTFPIMIPSSPSLIGQPVYFQGGVFDPQGLFFPGVAITAALRTMIGL